MKRDARLLTCREVGRMYRVDRAAVSAAAAARQIPSVRRGRAIYVSAKRAEELWGVDGRIA